MSDNPPRGYGLATGVFVVVAGMVGAGILTSSGYTLRETANPLGLLALWAVGGLMALCGAWCVVEMATAFPKVGGDYVFAREAFGPVAGLVVGWLSFLIGFAAPTAVVSRLAANYATKPFQSGLQALLSDPVAIYLEPALASIIIAVITWGHCLGQKQSASVQTATTVAKIAVLVSMGLAALVSPRADWGHFSASHWPDQAEWATWAVGLIYVGYAYAGWNSAGYLAGEMRDPRRLMPLSTLGGCGLVTGLYLLLNIAYIVALDPEGMRDRSLEEVGPVADLAMRNLFGGAFANLLSVVLGIGLVASVSSYLLAGSRLPVAMAQDGYLFRAVGRIHPTRHTPTMALIIQGGLAIAMCWSGTFLQILDYTSVGLTVISAMVVCSIFPLRRRQESGLAVRCPWHPVPALVFLGLSAWTIIFGLLDKDRFLPTTLCLVTVLAVIALGSWFYRGK